MAQPRDRGEVDGQVGEVDSDVGSAGDGPGDVRFRPIEAQGHQIAVEAVVLEDGQEQRDLPALIEALRQAGTQLGDDLLFLSVELGGARQAKGQVEDVVRAVRDSQVPPTRVVLQMSVDSVTAPYVGRALGSVRSAGIQVAVHEVMPTGICDCGTLAVDLAWVKVHACALDGLGTPDGDAALRQLVECSDGIEAVPMAAGVRSDAEAARLDALGIHVHQRVDHEREA